MARRGDIGWTDIINTGSNLYQNKQMAKQSALMEQQAAAQYEMSRQLERQAEMERMRENRRQNIIEARKTVVKLGEFSDKAVELSESYPEYSFMMTSIAKDVVTGVGLDSDFFEEISDMERAGEMNKKLESASQKIRGAMEAHQVSDAETMRKFLDTDEAALKELESHAQKKEAWSKKKSEFEELDPLHKRHFGWRKWPYMVGLPIALLMIFFAIGNTLAGECLAYDSDDFCEVHENQEMYDNMFALGGLSVLVGWYPGSRWSKKYLNQWEPLDEERQAVEAIEGRFNELSNEYGSSSSVKTAEIRKDKLRWISGMVPTLGLSLDIPGVVESGIRKNHFKDLDVNRDGRIDKEEFKAAVGEDSEEVFEELDKDGDGVLDEDEFAEFDEFDEFDAFDMDDD